MDLQFTKITLEMTEHEAQLILNLVRQEAALSAEIWAPYWENLAQTIQTCIDQAGSTQFKPWLITFAEELSLKEEPFYSTDIIAANPQIFHNFMYSFSGETHD